MEVTGREMIEGVIVDRTEVDNAVGKIRGTIKRLSKQQTRRERSRREVPKKFKLVVNC